MQDILRLFLLECLLLCYQLAGGLVVNTIKHPCQKRFYVTNLPLLVIVDLTGQSFVVNRLFQIRLRLCFLFGDYHYF